MSKLLFEDEVTGPDKDQFIAKVNQISGWLGYVPSWLMLVMYSETAGTFSASIKNPYSSATGLIQFMDSTAKELGTTTANLAMMNRVQQLDFVYKYYKMWQGRGKVAKDYADLYLITFYPYAVGKPDDYVIGSQVSQDSVETIAKLNRIIDINKDGEITNAEFKQYVYNKYVEGVVPDDQKALLTPGGAVIGVFFSPQQSLSGGFSSGKNPIQAGPEKP